MLIGLVLLQQGKGAEMGATLGGGGSNTLFGAGGATSFVTRLTTGTAIAFMVTSVLLVRNYSSLTLPSQPGSGDILQGALLQEETPTPTPTVLPVVTGSPAAIFSPSATVIPAITGSPAAILSSIAVSPVATVVSTITATSITVTSTVKATQNPK